MRLMRQPRDNTQHADLTDSATTNPAYLTALQLDDGERCCNQRGVGEVALSFTDLPLHKGRRLWGMVYHAKPAHRITNKLY